MKFKKIVKEADGGVTPKIYVGTYAKYNDGSIDGKWIDLADYSTYDDFVDACHELHPDEEDPEFMVQDFEGFPREWYHESGLPTEDEFYNIIEFYEMNDDEKEAYSAYLSLDFSNASVDDFRERYQGHFNSPSDFAQNLVDDLGWDGIGRDNMENYFDYEAFGRDLMMDFHVGDPDDEDSDGNPEDPDHYYDNDGYDQGEYQSDEQVAIDYVENIGGVSELGEQGEYYFDYEAFGRDLLMSDYTEEDGYVFRAD